MTYYLLISESQDQKKTVLTIQTGTSDLLLWFSLAVKVNCKNLLFIGGMEGKKADISNFKTPVFLSLH